MEGAIKVALFLQLISMWSSKEIECGSSGGGSKNLFRTEQNDDDDKAAPTTTNTATTAPPQVAAAESLRRLRLDKALWMHSPKIIQKRDSWDLVAASSDVINVDHGEISSDHSSARYDRYMEPQSPSGDVILSRQIVQMRLNKLQYYFRGLGILDENCRQRFLCELSKDPEKFFPLSSTFLDETSFTVGNSKDEKLLSARLLTSDEGARLLTYIEASQRGLNREGCDIWTYRCPRSIESLIDMKSLITWREVLKWLTVQMVARRHYPQTRLGKNARMPIVGIQCFTFGCPGLPASGLPLE